MHSLNQQHRPSGTHSILVARHLAERVKHALEQRGLLDRKEKIRKITDGRLSIPILLPLENGRPDHERAQEARNAIANDLGLDEATNQITCCARTSPQCPSVKHFKPSPDEIMMQAVRAWAEDVTPELLGKFGVSLDDLLASSPKVHAQYSPMLLLAKSAFISDCWRNVVRNSSSWVMQDLHKQIALRFQVTHVAKLGRIPVDNDSKGPLLASQNFLRSPHLLQPLHGYFGEYLPHPESSTALPRTLWVSTKQNGIHQCWAPLYSMFSRGNVAEKHRLLRSLLSERDSIDPAQSAAIDLYAGIGYFAFSYAKAGFRKVLCWDINPWSVEGLRRGAKMNRWSVISIPKGSSVSEKTISSGSEKLVVFEEDNAHAAGRIQSLGDSLPPIRHVNCGLLPTSEPTWTSALEILDAHLGGWIHVHENIADKERASRVNEVQKIFRQQAAPRQAHCEHIQAVKSYASGITHCVLEIYIYPA